MISVLKTTSRIPKSTSLETKKKVQNRSLSIYLTRNSRTTKRSSKRNNINKKNTNRNKTPI